MFSALFGHLPVVDAKLEPVFHDTVNDTAAAPCRVVYGVTASRNIRAQKNGGKTVQHAGDRRADIMIRINGHTYLFDVSINVPFNQKSPLNNTDPHDITPDMVYETVKASRDIRVKNKRTEAARHLPRQDLFPQLHFCPLAFDLGGGLEKSGAKVLNDLAAGPEARGILNKYLRYIAKTILRKTSELCWLPTARAAMDANYECDEDADHDADHVIDDGLVSEASLEQGAPEDILLDQLANGHDIHLLDGLNAALAAHGWNAPVGGHPLPLPAEPIEGNIDDAAAAHAGIFDLLIEGGPFDNPHAAQDVGALQAIAAGAALFLAPEEEDNG
jgi:hypothetical protein